MSDSLIIRHLGRQEYEPVWRAMQAFTNARSEETADEIWLTEHPPVFTLGVNSAPEHLLAPGDIPVIQIDRGGQVTWHGPGQLMVYPLLSLKRAGLGVRGLVTALEQSVIRVLADAGVAAIARCDAPGVYVDGAKLASVGLRIRRGCSFHGMAVNVDVDREPFTRINPCGMANLAITDLREQAVADVPEAAAALLLPKLLETLGLTDRQRAETRETPPQLSAALAEARRSGVPTSDQ